MGAGERPEREVGGEGGADTALAVHIAAINHSWRGLGALPAGGRRPEIPDPK